MGKRSKKVPSPAFKQFVDVARSFCKTVESSADFSKEEFLTRLYQLLPSLISAAINLKMRSPKSERLLPDRLSKEDRRALSLALGKKSGRDNVYWMVYDPRELEEPVAGSLADDVADIFGDLQPGLHALEKNSGFSLDDIEWEWRFNFEIHWGKHAVEALMVLHQVVHSG